MDTIDIVINKPMFGTFVYVRELYILKAQREHRFLKITIPGVAEIICTPSQWLENAKIMDKEFKIKGEPMRLYGNYVVKKEEIRQKSLF